MRRSRVLSFMSTWGSGVPKSPTQDSPSDLAASPVSAPFAHDEKTDFAPLPRVERPPSRPGSMLMSYQPPVMEIASDTPAELQPIFSHLNNHSNKLYQEGYFLKLHDLDSKGRPSTDRVWNECYAQLVGTVLSLWDAAQLDSAGGDGEVVPTFINLTDASIRMIESLPMNGMDNQTLQNVLSISTAANNRYLLHFNSLHSLTQWTAGIRLAMFEHITLQEAYTGSIIAGKGKHLNSIRSIMERLRFPTEDWARVRFGVGTPWRRCWCVISPPDEKEVQKAMKNHKKRSAYDRSAPVVKGDIKFYDTRKVTKKTKPIAAITDAYAAYAIYPQSKPLIDQSTLVKVEGTVTIYANEVSTSEAFIFVMPEVHPAITGFEMMLRWLFPVFDTFALYGRPNRLVADTIDTRSLMFAMPSGRKYGYLDLIDVAGLIHTEGSQNWSEKEWRKQMKNLTSKRLTAGVAPGRSDTGDLRMRSGSRSSLNLPTASSRASLNLGNNNKLRNRIVSDGVARSTPSSRGQSPSRNAPPQTISPVRTGSAPSLANPFPSPTHQRAVSDSSPYRREMPQSRLSFEPRQDNGGAPPPPVHGIRVQSPPAYRQDPIMPYGDESWMSREATAQSPDPFYSNSPDQYQTGPPQPPPHMDTRQMRPFRPVAAPPVMAHKSSAQPPIRPMQMSDLRRANSAIDSATLAQIHEANALQQRPSTGPGDQGLPLRGRPPMMQVQDDSQIYGYGYSYGYGYDHGNMNTNHMTGPPPPIHGGMGINGPPTEYRQPNLASPEGRQLPTIPGTPYAENDQFNLTPNSAQPPSRDRSSNSINRKPVPNRNSLM